MTEWTINDYTIPGFVEKRDIATPWFQSHENIYGRKAVLQNTVRDAKPFRMNIKLRGSGRYEAEEAIRDELQSQTVLIESTDKTVYKDQTSCWVVPTGFNVKDEERTLTCDLAGFVDERTLSSCDFTTGWTGASISAVSDTRFGTGAIKNTTTYAQSMEYAPTNAFDLGSYSYISLWHKESKSMTVQLRVSTSNSDYYRYDLTTSTAWSHETFSLDSPDATVGSPSLSNIADIGVYSSSTGTWDVYVGWVYAE